MHTLILSVILPFPAIYCQNCPFFFACLKLYCILLCAQTFGGNLVDSIEDAKQFSRSKCGQFVMGIFMGSTHEMDKEKADPSNLFTFKSLNAYCMYMRMDH